jgi:hypothetical protein
MWEAALKAENVSPTTSEAINALVDKASVTLWGV